MTKREEIQRLASSVRAALSVLRITIYGCGNVAHLLDDRDLELLKVTAESATALADNCHKLIAMIHRKRMS